MVAVCWQSRGPSVGDQIADLVRDPLDKASSAAEEWLLCGKRSIDQLKGKLGHR